MKNHEMKTGRKRSPDAPHTQGARVHPWPHRPGVRTPRNSFPSRFPPVISPRCIIFAYITITPQNRHVANYSNHATIRMMSVWKRTTKRLVHVQHERDAGGIKVATITQVHDGTHKRIYNNHEDSMSQESKYIYKDPNHT